MPCTNGLSMIFCSLKNSNWYSIMPQSLANVLIHLVFSTKNREPLIDPKVEQELYSYLVGICRTVGACVLKVGGIEDHIHMLITLPRTVAICKLVEEVKKSSSRWIKTKGPQFGQFSWQSGYGIFSISSSHKDAVAHYIACQRDHHHTHSFQDEYRRLLKRNDIEFDERYVWD